jgi:hypothetical protein
VEEKVGKEGNRRTLATCRSTEGHWRLRKQQCLQAGEPLRVWCNLGMARDDRKELGYSWWLHWERPESWTKRWRLYPAS